MEATDVLSRLEQLQALLIQYSKAGSGSDTLYRRLRLQLLPEVTILGKLPPFLGPCRDLAQFHHYMGQKHGSANWAPHIWAAFRPAFDRLEELVLPVSARVEEEATAAHGAVHPVDSPSDAMRPVEISTTAKGRPAAREASRILIGHGRSLLWRALKDFISDRLHLEWDEFNREPAAGISTSERLQTMLDRASCALLMMTAEDEQADGTVRARENVVHEAELFQGRLGFKRAILLLEEGCMPFSNIVGLTYIPFPEGKIEACFEQVRLVLEREGLI